MSSAGAEGKQVSHAAPVRNRHGRTAAFVALQTLVPGA